jgi:acetyl-CoA synthetase
MRRSTSGLMMANSTPVANCLDKHMGTPTENKTAIIFEADDGAVTKITYKELLARVSQFANALKAHGIKKGDRVLIYMPMTIEGVIAMQACARIGATHSVVFGGFSAKACKSASSTRAPWP